jgi:hypothetical protein
MPVMVHANQLIIIAGPSCVGKSFLINKIKQGDCSRLCKQLGMLNPSSWRYVGYPGLMKIHQPIIESLVLHNDFNANLNKDNLKHLHELINNADTIIIVTLMVPRSILVKRVNSRLLKSFFQLIGVRETKKSYNPGKLLAKILGLWRKRKAAKCRKVDLLYGKWFSYLNRFNITNHLLLDSSQPNDMRVYPYKKDKLGFSDIEELMDSQQYAVPINNSVGYHRCSRSGALDDKKGS